MFRQYLRQLTDFAGARWVASIALFIFSGFTQGVGLVMIIPLLQTLGISGGSNGNSVSAVTRIIQKGFNGMGLPLNLYTILGAYILIVSLFSIIKRFQAILNLSIQQGFVLYIRSRLYYALTLARWQFIVERKASDITHAYTADVQRVGQGTNLFLKFISDLALTSFHVGVALLLSFPLTAATLVFGIIMVLAMRPLNRKAQDSGESLRSSRKNLFGAVMEHLVGMKTAKSYGVEEHHLNKMSFINGELIKERLGFAKLRANTRMIYEIAAVIALALYFLAALKLEMFQVPIERLLVLVFIFTRIIPRFSAIVQSFQGIRNMIPSFEGLSCLYEDAFAAREVHLQKLENRETFIRIEGKVRFENVSFRYSKAVGQNALSNISFEIPAESITAIQGPSGAGKSTLADLLLGLLEPTEGRITVDGRRITPGLMQCWRHGIGYVPQETFLFHDSVRANLLWAMPSATETELWGALKQAAAESFVSGLPQGLDTVIGDRGLKLSGGERQRLALARALLRKPSLLLLDEATSALDSENEKRILNALQSLRNHLTIVIIAHRQTTVDYADQIITLTGDGRMVSAP